MVRLICGAASTPPTKNNTRPSLDLLTAFCAPARAASRDRNRPPVRGGLTPRCRIARADCVPVRIVSDDGCGRALRVALASAGLTPPVVGFVLQVPADAFLQFS